MAEPMVPDRTYTAADMQRLVGMGPRLVRDWCIKGIFGPHHLIGPGSGSRRYFTDTDLIVARTCKAVSDAMDPGATGGRGGARPTLLRAVADQVRAGKSLVRVQLSPDVELTVRVIDVHLRPADEGVQPCPSR